MKLVRFGPVGNERPGVIDGRGDIRDVSSVVPDFTGDYLSDKSLAWLAAAPIENLPVVDPSTRLGPPVAGTRNFIGIGLNYRDHAAETGAPIPAEPIMFIKSVNAICGPNDTVPISTGMTKVDWEVELAVVIGKRARNVADDAALSHVAGYCICNDVSERAWQLERGGSWDKGKGYDNFGPLGPWLVTREEVPDPQSLRMTLSVDGVVKQDGSTRNMIFPVSRLVSYVSGFITLHPGDVITTGTPHGVGVGRNPPEFLVPGNRVVLEIEKLGEQRQLFERERVS